MVMRAALFWTFVLVCLIFAVADPSFAQMSLPRGGPAPLIGMIGLPIAGLVIAAVWLARRWGRD
jgi:hypothetical protein